MFRIFPSPRLLFFNFATGLEGLKLVSTEDFMADMVPKKIADLTDVEWMAMMPHLAVDADGKGLLLENPVRFLVTNMGAPEGEQRSILDFAADGASTFAEGFEDGAEGVEFKVTETAVTAAFMRDGQKAAQTLMMKGKILIPNINMLGKVTSFFQRVATGNIDALVAAAEKIGIQLDPDDTALPTMDDLL